MVCFRKAIVRSGQEQCISQALVKHLSKGVYTMMYYSNLQENENLNHDNNGFAQSFEATKDCGFTCMILGAYTGPHF